MLKAIRSHPGVCCPYLLAKYMCVCEFFLNHYFLCQCPSIAYLHSAYFFQYKIFLVYIQPHHFMANRWGNSGNSGWLHFFGLQNHCRWWLQPWNLKTLLGRKVMTNLDSIQKSRDITLSTKVRLDKATVFPVVMYGCVSWTMKKAERRRVDSFELWSWRRLLRIAWTPRRSN